MTALPLLLPQNVFLTPVEDLPEETRARIACGPGAWVLSRFGSRESSSLIDSDGAELLRRFREPATIEDAILGYCLAHAADAKEILRAAWPLLESALRSGYLVPAGVTLSRPAIPFWAQGCQVGEFVVDSCVLQLEDNEVYRVRGSGGHKAALKILFSNAGAASRSMLAREACILEHLNGSVSPRLLQAGSFDNRPYLATEWCEGVVPTVAAAELRRRGDRPALLRLGLSVLDAYVRLHAAGVVHSDVNPTNLVSTSGGVTILDFGLALWPNAIAPYGFPPRGGAGSYYEPELARACLGRAEPPRATFAGEQYALAALLYLLFTGAHYRDFSLVLDRAMRQIAQDPPLSFVSRGVPEWPDVEHILCRALAKDPADRFPSVVEFADHLGKVSIPAEKGDPILMAGESKARRLLDQVLGKLAPSESLFRSGIPRTPACSVVDGAAGIAYALYRLCCLRADPLLLSWADLWSTRAASTVGPGRAFYSPDLVGPVSLYHTLSGVHCVRALVAQALQDSDSRKLALAGLASSQTIPCANVDLWLGRSGLLLGASLLLDAIPRTGILEEMGAALESGIWDRLDSFGPILESSELPYLGIAHGWAGVLYATLCWRRSLGRDLPGSVLERLDQLARCAEPFNRGFRWRRQLAAGAGGRGCDYLPGWCNGSAGFIHLWTLAWRHCCEKRYLQLAEGAAWDTWESPEGSADLCCGLGGRAYGLLNLYKLTGEADWLDRARLLADRAAARLHSADTSTSLYHGSLGVALLAADLASPVDSSMPLFEDEGWSVTAT
jgi:eukaryotic-like serine/threonine-protein kinase